MKKILFIITFCICALCGVSVLIGCNSSDANDINDSDNEVHLHAYDEWMTSKLPTCTDDGIRERYCACGEKQTSVISALGHDFIEHEAQLATCTKAGWDEYRTCSRCEYSSKVTVSALGHDIHSFSAQSATCTQAGNRAYEACTRCDYSTYVEIPAFGHNFGEWNFTAATCSSEGSQTRVCLNDKNHTESKPIQKLPHTESDWITVDATCDKAGIKYTECTVCSAKIKTEEISPLGHLFGNWAVTTQATCFSDGVETRTCLNDETHKETREIDKIQHIESDWRTIAPTCDTAGRKYKECTICNFELENEVISPLGHDYGGWNVEKQATCKEEGIQTRICSRDGTHVDTKILAKIPHTESAVITVEATCTTDGTRYRECTQCHTILDSELLPASGHSPKTQYIKNETSHTLKCATCNEVINESPHDWYDNDCVTCGYDAGGLKGLNWVLNDGNTSYSVGGIGKVTVSEIEIPSSHNGKSVTGIKIDAFKNCVQLTQVKIPNSIISIGVGAFEGCNNLEKITLPFVGAQVDCDITYFGHIFGALSYEENKDKVPSSLKTVVITGGTAIDSFAFKDCESIISVTMPTVLNVIGQGAFYGCSGLDNVIIPSTVTEIGRYAFYGCTNLKQAQFEITEGWTVNNGGTTKNISKDYLINSDILVQYLTKDYLWKRSENV